MLTLSNQIDQRAKSLDVQILRAKKVYTQTDIDWIKCIGEVNNLSAKFEDIFRETLAKTPKMISKNYRKGGCMIEVNLGKILNFEVILYLFESISSGVTYAKYIAFNKIKGSVYSRDLLNI